LSEVTENFVSQVYFSKDIYPREKDSGKDYFLNSININKCEFKAKNYSSIENSHFHSVLFYRKNSDISYSNISIKNSKFNYTDFKNGISDAINLSNNRLSNFRNQNTNYYINNKNIEISGNQLVTDSRKPGAAIFIQGPFKNVHIEENFVNGFGLNMLSNNQVASDGTIHLYGARQLSHKTKYSNNIEDVYVRNNTLINCKSNGIRLSGFRNAVVVENLIEIANESEYWKKYPIRQDIIGIAISTGDYNIAEKQSTKAEVKSNVIYCNNNSIGILIKFAKNFNIIQNEIYQPSSYGILYFANKNVVESNIGVSSVEANIIDFQNKSFDDLKSDFFNRGYKIKYSGINFWREFKDSSYTNSNENLSIQNNEIKITDKKINKIQHNLTQTEKSNIYLIEEYYTPNIFWFSLLQYLSLVQ